MSETLPDCVRLATLAITLLGWIIIYFLVNRLEVELNRRIDFGFSLDRRIPYLPIFVLVYFSSYLFVVQSFFVFYKSEWFYWMLASFALISLISSLIHAAVPSKIDRVENVTLGGISGWLLALFQKNCKPYGNFPSMHVGLSVPVVAAYFLADKPILGGIMLVWAVLIALSTLFTKQHYILDVLAGFLGGLAISAMAFWLIKAVEF